LINGLGRSLRAKLKGDETSRVTNHQSPVTFRN
jgi:hypothetical protein